MTRLVLGRVRNSQEFWKMDSGFFFPLGEGNDLEHKVRACMKSKDNISPSPGWNIHKREEESLLH